MSYQPQHFRQSRFVEERPGRHRLPEGEPAVLWPWVNEEDEYVGVRLLPEVDKLETLRAVVTTLDSRVTILERVVLEGNPVPPKGTCFWCQRDAVHLWHDNGTYNS